MEKFTSADGTTIAYEMTGSGPASFRPLEGADHEATPGLIAPAVIEFLTS